MAEMAVWGTFFEHLSTSVNGVGKRDEGIRNSSSGILLVAHFCSLHRPSDATQSRCAGIAATAVHRFLLVVGIGFVFYPVSGRY
jgi:hypothetical protein